MGTDKAPVGASNMFKKPAESAGIVSSGIISFTIPGKPMAWERSRHSGKIHFDSKKQTSNKGTLHMYATQAYSGELIDVPIAIKVWAFFPASKELMKKRPKEVEAEIIPFTARPDSDNICKLIGDALNGVLWRDDSLIVDVFIFKRYSMRPRTEISLDPIVGAKIIDILDGV